MMSKIIETSRPRKLPDYGVLYADKPTLHDTILEIDQKLKKGDGGIKF